MPFTVKMLQTFLRHILFGTVTQGRGTNVPFLAPVRKCQPQPPHTTLLLSHIS
uniref:Uncharacterized protein n=1 Tax=Anguilla anguilla TaxID=7936 RepID=A0A0E9XE66_ANGAN